MKENRVNGQEIRNATVYEPKTYRYGYSHIYKYIIGHNRKTCKEGKRCMLWGDYDKERHTAIKSKKQFMFFLKCAKLELLK